MIAFLSEALKITHNPVIAKFSVAPFTDTVLSHPMNIIKTPTPYLGLVSNVWQVSGHLLKMAEGGREQQQANQAPGYSYEFIDTVPEDYYCYECKLVAKDLTFTSCCGETFCLECIEKYIQEGKPCPNCKVEGVMALKQVKYQSRIRKLSVACDLKERGCEWEGHVEDMEAHLDPALDNCQYVDIQCPLNCQQKIPKNEMDEHLKNSCVKRDFFCQYCNYKASYEEVKNVHLEECRFFPLQCPNRCGVTCEREDMEDHLKICRLQEIECEFANIGCGDKFCREDMTQHMDDNSFRHLMLVASHSRKSKEESEEKMKEFTRKMILFTERMDEVTRERDELKGRMESHQKEHAELKGKMEAQQKEHEDIKGKMGAQQKKHEVLQEKMEAQRKEHEELKGKMEAQQKEHEALTGKMEAQQKKHEVLQGKMEAQQKEHEELKGKMEAQQKEHEEEIKALTKKLEDEVKDLKGDLSDQKNNLTNQQDEIDKELKKQRPEVDKLKIQLKDQKDNFEKSLKEKQNDFDTKILIQKKQIEDLKKEFDKKMDESNKKYNQQETEVKDGEIRLAELTEHLEELELLKAGKDESAENARKLEQKVKEFRDKLSEDVRKLSDKTERNEKQMAAYQEGIKKLQARKPDNSLEEIKRLKEMTDRHVERFLRLEEKLPKVNAISDYLGNFERTFEMKNFTMEKDKNKARDWKSPAMYTHMCGYKFCIGLDANGRGGSQGEAIYAELYVMPGEYDSLLRWPAKASFTLELIHQRGGKNVKYNTAMKKWDKPELNFKCLSVFPYTEVNNSYCFLEHNKLGDFLVDDTLKFCTSVVLH